jgi:DNA polymerase elongation subunit (family B)
MADGTGWILDVSIEQNRAIIWIKTIEGNILKLLDSYHPNFYVLPKDESLFEIMSQEPMVSKVEWVQKFTDLFDTANHGLRRLISVYTKSTHALNTLIKRLDKDTRVSQLFDTDLSPVQQYLFKTLEIEPTSKVEVDYDDNTFSLISVTTIDDDTCAPPPFSILYFDILHNFDRSEIRQIRARHQDESFVSFEGDEESTIKKFHEYIMNKDPDILVYSTDNHTFVDDIIRTLGREPNKGRVCLESKSLDLAGLIERARFGFLPMGQAARYGYNRLIDSRNCYTLIQKGFAIQANHSRVHEPIRTLEEINAKDKAGMIFSPKVGLHENVVVLDYENEYANLIICNNLSPETINASLSSIQKCLLPRVLENVLKRRMYFKKLQQSFPANSNEWVWCQQRIDALKSILVSLYGTTGSFWNRFANVLVFEEINRLAREVLIKTKDIVQENGFELLYADTDSVFLRKKGAPIEEYENVTQILSKEIGIPISIEQHYKFLVLLPLEASERMEALKHYFGITQSGEIIARGIEIRRHDAPNFIKEFQTELLYTLFDCQDSTEVLSKGYENVLLLITTTIDKVMTGEVQLQDLVVTKVLGQGLEKYKSLFPHVSAAILLAKKGRTMAAGEGVEYIYTNTHHTNPLYRVVPKAFIEENGDVNYDKEKYRDMLLEAAETVLSIFGFNRTAYGDAPKKYKKWWQRLNEEKLRDMDTETI